MALCQTFCFVFSMIIFLPCKLKLALNIFLQVYGAKADFPCKTQQIHWIGSPGRRYKCLECPDCPAGLQPSVPCGSSVAFGTSIHCVPCQLDKTYSNKYGKVQCEACTVCSKGKAIKKNCTLFSNAECDDKCASGFYPEPFIFDCFPCAKCCGDGEDETALECANYENKCKVRSTPCTNVPATKAADITTHILKRLSPTKPSKTSTATQAKRHSQTTTQRTSSAMHRTRPVRLENESTARLRTHITKLPSTSSVSSTLSANNRKAVQGRVIVSREKNGESNPFVILTAALASLTMLAILGLVAFIVCERRGNLRGNDVATVERPTQRDQAASSLQVQMNPSKSLL